MSISITYPFTNASNYIFTSSDVQVSGGNAQLKLQEAYINYTQNFTNDTGFVYDNTKSEFVGGKNQQKDQRPADATFYASYTNNVNASWSDGVGTGTLNGGATVSGGRLDLTGGANKCATYDGINNANSPHVGCWRIRWTPNWNGIYGSVLVLMTVGNIGNSNNRMQLIIDAVGRLAYLAYDKNGNLITPGNALFIAVPWNPVSGTTYEFEFNYDFTSGAIRLFIDGTQWGSTLNQTSANRDTNINDFIVGANITLTSSIEGYINDVLIFSDVQHTSNYVPDWSGIPEYIYANTTVTLPEFEHIGDGSMISFNTFFASESGVPKYTIQIGRSGNYLYWNGAAWAVSDGSYAQSTDEAAFNVNCGSLPISGEKYIQFKVHYTDTNTQGAIDQLTANIYANSGYLTTNPTIEPVSILAIEALESFVETATKIGSDQIKYILKKDNAWYYWDGSSWTISNQTYAQSNTATEIETNKASFTINGISFKWRAFLHSNNGLTTPLLDAITILYDFFAIGETLNKCVVWGYIYDLEGQPSTDIITIQLNEGVVKYKTETTVRRELLSVTPNNIGYWEAELVENENMEGNPKYIFDFGINGVFVRTVPNVVSKNFYLLT